MPKSPVQRENAIRRRLDNLELQLQLKDDELAKLDKTLHDEIAKRDVIISDLNSKIDSLISANDLMDTPQLENVEKVEHDLLLIGDSIVRHVDSESINPGGDTEVKCLPGARPDDVVNEFRKMSQHNSYKRIIVHVGSNLIPKFSRSYTAAKVTECLEMVKELSPQSRIAFSPILPKDGDHLLAGIDEVNHRVIQSGQTGPIRTRFGFANHARCMQDNLGHVDPGLFVDDGIHLSRRGIKAFEYSLKGLVSM